MLFLVGVAPRLAGLAGAEAAGWVLAWASLLTGDTLAALEPEDLDEVFRVRVQPVDAIGQRTDGDIELADRGAADHRPPHPRAGVPATGRDRPDHANGRGRLSGRGEGDRRGRSFAASGKVCLVIRVGAESPTLLDERTSK